MIEKIEIRDNSRSALSYIRSLKGFENGKVFEFKPGINILIGENGSGKTTLINLIRAYTMVDGETCGRGMFNINVHKLADLRVEGKILDGVRVYGDYTKNVFSLLPFEDRNDDVANKNFIEFGAMFESKSMSKGMKLKLAMVTLFEKMFGGKTDLTFDYKKELEGLDIYESMMAYIDENRVMKHDEYTMLMDEPDASLDVDNIDELYGVLGTRKEQVQVIASVHNPFLIYMLAKSPDVNIIETSEGYLELVKSKIGNFFEK